MVVKLLKKGSSNTEVGFLCIGSSEILPHVYCIVSEGLSFCYRWVDHHPITDTKGKFMLPIEAALKACTDKTVYLESVIYVRVHTESGTLLDNCPQC